jgi:transcriptional regulator with XRE-family HTH domain
MKKDDYPKDLYIGSMIKDIMEQKKDVALKEIADLILKYQKNTHKIYDLYDMDSDDLAKTSCLLKYNFLRVISEKYLSHLPFHNYIINGSRLVKFDLENRKIIIYDPFDNCDFLDDVNVGQLTKEIAERKGWNEKEMAKQSHCSQGTVSNWYNSKSLKVKKLIQISEVLKHNLIAEAYLSQMTVVSELNLIDGCIVALHPLPQVYIKNPDNDTFSVVFKQNKDEKQECYRTKTNRKSYKN